MDSLTNSVRLDFGNLPLIEAALRTTLSSPLTLTYAVIGSLAKQLEPKFPAVSEPKQLELAPGIGPSPTEFGPGVLPGAVYTGHAQGLSISVHPQVVVARWAKQFSPQDKSYPRFPLLRDALWNAVEMLGKTVGDEFPPPAVVNMSYTNFVPMPDPASDVRSYFSERAQLGMLDEARQVRKLEAAWSEAHAIDVRFTLEQVTAKLGDEISEGYRLTTIAGKRLAGSLDAKKDLEEVHARLQTFFLDLISDKARTEWRLTQAPNA